MCALRRIREVRWQGISLNAAGVRSVHALCGIPSNCRQCRQPFCPYGAITNGRRACPTYSFVQCVQRAPDNEKSGGFSLVVTAGQLSKVVHRRRLADSVTNFCSTCRTWIWSSTGPCSRSSVSSPKSVYASSCFNPRLCTTSSSYFESLSCHHASFPSASVRINIQPKGAWSVWTVSGLPSRKGHKSKSADTREMHLHSDVLYELSACVSDLDRYIIDIGGPSGCFWIKTALTCLPQASIWTMYRPLARRSAK